MQSFDIVWSSYFKYRMKLRGFKVKEIEKILRHSTERYFDTRTNRRVVIGKHDNDHVIIPYDTAKNQIIPVTVHIISRKQINFRCKTGRFIYE